MTRLSRRTAAALVALATASVTVLAGCRAPAREVAAPVSGVIVRTVHVAGTERSYLVHIPSGSRPGRPLPSQLPVVLSFHGGAQDAEQQRAMSRLDATADAHGFVVVYPQGVPNLIGSGRSWNAGSCCAHAQDAESPDVAFTSALLDDLEEVVDVDPRRVYATGMSNGGMLAYRLACELSDRIAAVAVVAGALVVSPCQPARPVSVLHIHGTADAIVPVQGGVGSNPLLGSFPSVADSVAVFAAAAGCTSGPVGAPLVRDRHVSRYLGCLAGAAVKTVLVVGGGHTWPGGAPFPAGGVTSTQTSASRLAWAFFARHPMPLPPAAPSTTSTTSTTATTP